MTEPTAVRDDPSARFESAFRAIAVRMTGLPFVNPALRVEAVAFAPWNGHWLGVLVTPWFMNLVLAPCDASLWRPLAQGEKRRYAFPAGEYDFIGARDDAAGEYQCCSLFSPVAEFDDHETARQVATSARAALFDPANAPGAADVPLQGAAKRRAEPMSKRDFLRGRFMAGGHDDRG